MIAAHQRQCNREPAFFQRESERQCQGRKRAGRKHCACGHEARPLLAVHQLFGGEPVERGKQEREAGKRQRPIQFGNAVIERDQHRERKRHTGGRP
jgi:hypothetical protein